MNKLQIVAVLRDWKQSEAEFKPDYPKSPIVIVGVPLWPTSQQDEFVEERVRIHQQAEQDYLNDDPIQKCSEAERWARPAKYAVMKKRQEASSQVT